MKNNNDTSSILSDLLLKLPEDRQTELLAQWRWQDLLAQEQHRNMRRNYVLSSLLALLGVVLGVALSRL